MEVATLAERAVGKSAVGVKVNVDNTRDNIYYVISDNTEIYDFP